MEVFLKWDRILSEYDERWQYNRGLYAYLAPNRKQTILYIGKIDGCTVRARHRANDKQKVWRKIEHSLGFYKHSVIVATLYLENGRRFTSGLLTDIESLLIHYVQPFGNTSNTKTRYIARPGLKVICKGDWYFSQKTFVDIGPTIAVRF